MKPAVKRDWPLLPKMSWRGVLPATFPALTGLKVAVDAGLRVDVCPAADVATVADDQLAHALVQATATAQRVVIPANWQGAPVQIDAAACGVVQIDVGRGAQVVIREVHEQALVANALLLVVNLAENAQVDLTTVDLTPGDVAFYRQVNVGRNARFVWHATSFGPDAGFIYHSVNLTGQGATTDVKMAALTTSDSRLIVTTAVTNVAAKTEGLITQHGVASGGSELLLNGIGSIVRGARGSNAQQENRVLMLSDRAEAESNPLLLIDENDVTAGHAASVSSIDQQQMYYLESRGLPDAVAVRLVVRGFLLGLLPENLDAGLMTAIQTALGRQLGGLFDEHDESEQ